MEHLQRSLDYIEENLGAELTVRELSETFPQEPERWLECWRGLMEGYAPTGAERKAAPLVLLGSQMVCVAWFAEQEKYRELFETNQKMTLWLLEHFTEL